jgi:Ca2+-binding RTX toxin-like protein
MTQSLAVTTVGLAILAPGASATERIQDLSIAEQQVPIPAAPAALRFMLKRQLGAGSITFTVRLDGTTVATTPLPASSFPYTAMTADVSQFAGPGGHDLRFEFTCVNTCGRLDVDDVSLDAADPPGPPPPPPVTCGGKIATIVGTAAGDTLTGTPGNDVIAALGGNDTVKAGRGNDVVCGGSGNDRLIGGRGRDRLLGQGGNDLLKGGPGRRDLCDGGDGKDRSARSCEQVPA